MSRENCTLKPSPRTVMFQGLLMQKRSPFRRRQVFSFCSTVHTPWPKAVSYPAGAQGASFFRRKETVTAYSPGSVCSPKGSGYTAEERGFTSVCTSARAISFPSFASAATQRKADVGVNIWRLTTSIFSASGRTTISW